MALSKTGVAVLAISIVVTAAFPAPTEATAATAAATPANVAALMRAQIPLDRAADKIEASAGTLANSGFAGVSVSPSTASLTVYWQGSLPPSVTAVLDEARASGMGVSIKSARYSRQQLRLEAKRLGRLATSSSHFTSITARFDGAGIDVGVDMPTTNTTTMAPLANTLNSSVRTNFVYRRPKRTDRSLYLAPYIGGSIIRNAAGTTGCSSGFAVTDETLRYMLTAAHCSPSGTDTWMSPFGDTIGTVQSWDGHHDAMLIGMPDGSSQFRGEFYDGTGAYDPANQQVDSVRSWHTSHVGDFVCADGALTGEACNAQVTATGTELPGFNGGPDIEDVITADQQSDPKAALTGDGDSGGPVHATGLFDLKDARGTITAGDLTAPATCPDGNASRNCSSRVYFPDITWQLADLSMRPVLGNEN
jgi:hypothetical protein